MSIENLQSALIETKARLDSYMKQANFEGVERCEQMLAYYQQRLDQLQEKNTPMQSNTPADTHNHSGF